MERKKTRRLGLLRYEKLDLRYCVMSTFWEQLQDAFIRGLPSARDFASFPAIKALLDAPDDVEVTIDDFTALRDNVPEYVAEFQRHQKLAIQELIEKELDLEIRPADPKQDVSIPIKYTQLCAVLLMYLYPTI